MSATFHGQLKLWSKDGTLIASARKHGGPIFSAAWNPKDSILLTCGFDTKIIAWSIPSLQVLHIYSHHTLSVLEVDWKDDELFASCSRDKTLCISSITDKDYLVRLEGHINEINTISWSPDKKFLASCSDDKTIKIWRIEQEPFLVADLKGHSKEVYTLDWSPKSSSDHLIASASKDNSVRIWDIKTSKCIRELLLHSQAVYSVRFSPNAKYIASGGFDGRIVVWQVSDGKIVRTLKSSSGVFEVSWNSSGDKIAAAYSKQSVFILFIYCLLLII